MSALGQVLLFWFASMAVLVAVSAGAKVAGDHSGLLIGAMGATLTFALTLVFVRWDRKRLHDFGFDFTRRSASQFCAGLLIGLALVAAHTAVMALLAPMRWTPAPAVRPLQVLMIMLTFLLLSAREELAFRGYPLRKLSSDLRPWAAQLIVALMFAVEHVIGGANWSNALLGAGMGSLVFGLAALATRSLAMPIGLHAAWNVGDWARGGKGDGGLWRSIVEPGSEQAAQFVGMASYVAVMSFALLALWAWQLRNDRFES